MTHDLTLPQNEPENRNESQDSILAHRGDGMIKRYVFAPGTILFTRGETRQCAYLIDRGEVEIIGNDEGGEDKRLCVLSEGEIFGEMALVDNTKRTATAITKTECEIFVIPRDSLHKRLKGLDPIVSLLISLLIERYRVTRLHMPESLRQDITAFKNKIGKYESTPEEISRLRNTDKQRDIALQEMKLEQELRAGIEKKEFVPFLQPILDLRTRRVVGFETLVRWKRPHHGLVFPDEFIPVAERTAVIQQIDAAMLEKACEILPRIQKIQGGENLFISVNLSGINFETIDIVNSVRRTITESGADPSYIKLEITESALIDDPEQAEKVLLGLKALGLTISLDDFGTGYSSLGYLHKFTIDDLKIDRTFVVQLHDGRRSLDIVRAIIALAKNFKLNVIAEGIESEEDIIALTSLDCDMGQGYLFSRPLPVEEALRFLESNLQESSE